MHIHWNNQITYNPHCRKATTCDGGKYIGEKLKSTPLNENDITSLFLNIDIVSFYGCFCNLMSGVLKSKLCWFTLILRMKVHRENLISKTCAVATINECHISTVT